MGKVGSHLFSVISSANQDFIAQERLLLLQTRKDNTGISTCLCLRDKLAGGLQVCQAFPCPILIKFQMEVRTDFLYVLSQLVHFLVSLSACG